MDAETQLLSPSTIQSHTQELCDITTSEDGIPEAIADLRVKLSQANLEKNVLEEQANEKVAAANAQVKRLQTCLNHYVREDTNTSQAELEKLKKENETLTVRLNAMENILSLQERSLSHAKELHDTSGIKHSSAKEDPYDLLISRWRQRVFELLVQKMTNDLEHSTHIGKYRQQISVLQTALDESHVERDILKNCCTSRDAQIALQQTTLMDLQKQIQSSRASESRLRATAKSHHDAIRNVVDAVNSSYAWHVDKVNEIMSHTNQFDLLQKRIEYAAQRTQTIEYFVKLKKPSVKSEIPVDTVKESMSAGSHDLLQKEVDTLREEVHRLQREKQFLMSKIQEDNDTFSSRVQEAESAILSNLAEANDRAKHAEEASSTVQTELNDAIEERERLHKELESKKSILKSTENSHQEALSNLEQNCDARVAELCDGYESKVVSLQNKIIELRKDDAKKSAQIKQLQYDLARTAEKQDEIDNDRFNDLLQRNAELEMQLKIVITDRNALMAKLQKIDVGKNPSIAADRPAPRLLKEAVPSSASNSWSFGHSYPDRGPVDEQSIRRWTGRTAWQPAPSSVDDENLSDIIPRSPLPVPRAEEMRLSSDQPTAKTDCQKLQTIAQLHALSEELLMSDSERDDRI